MADYYKTLHPERAMRQGRNAVTITAADSDLTDVIKGINVSVAGVVRVTAADDSSAVDLYLAAGIMHGGLEIKRVWSTGTDTAVKAGTIIGIL